MDEPPIKRRQQDTQMILSGDEEAAFSFRTGIQNENLPNHDSGRPIRIEDGAQTNAWDKLKKGKLANQDSYRKILSR